MNKWTHELYKIKVVSGFTTVKIIKINRNPPINSPMQWPIKVKKPTVVGYGVIEQSKKSLARVTPIIAPVNWAIIYAESFPLLILESFKK